MSGQEGAQGALTPEQIAAAQTLLVARGLSASGLWRNQRESFVAGLAERNVIPENAQRSFGRAYLRTVLAPEAMSEVDRVFASGFAEAMTAQERADPSAVSPERQLELVRQAEPRMSPLLRSIHVAGIADGCEESRARAALCLGVDVMLGPNIRWRR